MQKLLRICPVTSCSSSPSTPSLLLCSHSFLSPPKPKKQKPTSSIMPSLSHHLPLIPTATTSLSQKKQYSALSPRSLTESCRVCRCFIDDKKTNPHRPWPLLNEFPSGSRFSWLCTAAGDDGAVVEEEERRESGVEESDSDSDSSSEEEKGSSVSSSCSSSSNSEEKGSDGSDSSVVKVQRRVRGGGQSGNLVLGLPGKPELLSIRGVGPKYLRKLVDKGLGGVAELKQLYKDKFFGDSDEKMVDYLRKGVGIQKHHAKSIASYIIEAVDQETKEEGNDGIRVPKKRITLCVEGNISVGKTTFLKRIANETLELRDLVEIVPEPIDKWQNVGREGFNILDAFYADPARYAYTFQNYVFVTRVMQERDSSGGMLPLRLMERSVFSDRMVFVRAVHEAKWMNEMELGIYDSWFDPVVSYMPGLVPDGFIYLRASPDTCHKRMMLRKRTEEGGVSLDYLRDLHEKHESWLYPCDLGKHGLSISELPLHSGTLLDPAIKDQVYYLEGPAMHPSLQKIPTLILDCDYDIDFNKDIDAKENYARQVAQFFRFVEKEKEVQSNFNEAGKVSPRQVIGPPGDGLLFPGVNSLHDPSSFLRQGLEYSAPLVL